MVGPLHHQWNAAGTYQGTYLTLGCRGPQDLVIQWQTPGGCIQDVDAVCLTPWKLQGEPLG
jgi:hypothetical protein